MLYIANQRIGLPLTSHVVVKGCVAFNRDMTSELVSFLEARSIRPVIAKTFEFDEAVEAFEALKKQKEVGKIIIRIGKE